MSHTLAIDTSTSVTSIALQTSGGKRYVVDGEASTSHNEELAEGVRQILHQASLQANELSLIVLGSGPGSFTGLRIGYSFVRGFSVAWGIPILQLPSLQAVVCSSPGEAEIKVGIGDARRGEVYAGIFRFTARELQEVVLEIGLFGYAELHEQVQRVLHERELGDADVEIVCAEDFECQLPYRVGQTGSIAVGLLDRAVCCMDEKVLPGLSMECNFEPTYIRPVAAKTIAERQNRAEEGI